MSEENYVSVSEAAEILKEAGILKGKFIDQAVRRLVKSKELDAITPPPNQPKVGFKISKSSLDEYLTVGKMSITELRKELLQARKKLSE